MSESDIMDTISGDETESETEENNDEFYYENRIIKHANTVIGEINDCCGHLNAITNCVMAIKQALSFIDKPPQEATKLMTKAEKHNTAKADELKKLEATMESLKDVLKKKKQEKEQSKKQTPKQQTKKPKVVEITSDDEEKEQPKPKDEKKDTEKEVDDVHQKNEAFFQDVMRLLNKFTSELKSMLLTHLELKEKTKQEDEYSDDDN